MLDLKHLKVFDANTFQGNYEDLSSEIKSFALETYLQEGEEFLEIITSTQNCVDDEKMERALHSLKTMSKFVGATRISAICECIEEKNSGEDNSQLQTQLNEEWKAFKVVIDKSSLKLQSTSTFSNSNVQDQGPP